MSDSLTIWGTDYTGVTGFKAGAQLDGPAGKNLYNPATKTDGYYLTSSGSLYPDDTCSISDYIAVIPGENYVWSGISGKTGTNNKRVVGYSEKAMTSPQVIQAVSVSGIDIPYENSFVVPSGIYFIKLSYNTADGEMMVEHGTTKTNYEPYTNIITYAYVRPQGTKSITENGNNIDVSEYASASVNVDRSGGHVDQEGSSIVIPADELDGGFSIDQMLTPGLPALSGAITYSGTELPIGAFDGNTGITSFTGNNVTDLQTRSRYGNKINWTYTFYGCTNLETINLPSLSTLAYCDYAFANCTSLVNFNIPFKTMSSLGAATFSYCTHLPSLVLPAFNDPFAADLFSYCTDMEYIDVGESVSSTNAGKFLQGNSLRYSSSLDTLIFRNTSYIFVLQNISAFTGTPFASDGVGGTLYVPNDLISSYQSATNWSTILGYANNQIKSIESTHTDPNATIDLTLYYADGTEIPST